MRIAVVLVGICLAGCAARGPLSEGEMRARLEYLRAPSGDFVVSTDPLDKSFQDLGPVKLNPHLYASVVPSYHDADYSLYLVFQYEAYGTLPFGGVTMAGKSFSVEQVTVPHVDQCSHTGRCTFVDFYSVKITDDVLEAIAAAPTSYPVEIGMGNQRLVGSISAAEARQIRAAVQAAL